jgi:hypothetical protein
VSLPDEPRRSPGRLLVAGALIVVGMLILVPSGLCTAVMGFGIIASMIANPGAFIKDVADLWQFAIMLLGAVAIGALLLRAGISIGRPR